MEVEFMVKLICGNMACVHNTSTEIQVPGECTCTETITMVSKSSYDFGDQGTCENCGEYLPSFYGHLVCDKFEWKTYILGEV